MTFLLTLNRFVAIMYPIGYIQVDFCVIFVDLVNLEMKFGSGSKS
jgi:hypothetical protein